MQTVEQRVYTAVKGSHLTDADAAIVGPELEALAAAKGAADVKTLTPTEIVDAARGEASPSVVKNSPESSLASYCCQVALCRRLTWLVRRLDHHHEHHDEENAALSLLGLPPP